MDRKSLDVSFMSLWQLLIHTVGFILVVFRAQILDHNVFRGFGRLLTWGHEATDAKKPRWWQMDLYLSPITRYHPIGYLMILGAEHGLGLS